MHNIIIIIKQCVFIPVDPEIITMGCLNLVRGDSIYNWMCSRLAHPMVIIVEPTWTYARRLMSCASPLLELVRFILEEWIF